MKKIRDMEIGKDEQEKSERRWGRKKIAKREERIEIKRKQGKEQCKGRKIRIKEKVERKIE